MIALRPDAAEERWLALVARLPAARDGGLPTAELTGHWKTLGLMKRSAMFLLGAVVAALSYGVLELLHLPGNRWICAATLWIAAEWLIVGRRLFGCGIEEALEGACVLIIVTAAGDFSQKGFDSTVWLLAAAGFGLAGLRLLNPLFSTISVIASSAAVYEFSAPQLHGGSPGPLIAGGYCFAVGAAALCGCLRNFRRPSIDGMVGWLVVAMPACGYLWISDVASPAADCRLTLSLPLLFAAAALIVGIRGRLHAPLAAFMVGAGCFFYELRHISGLSPQARLVLGGGVVLLIAIALDRHLRKPRRGVTSRQLEDDDSLDLLELGGAAALAPQGPHGPDKFQGGGGASSGGGASGSF
jgi:hypothetical protein